MQPPLSPAVLPNFPAAGAQYTKHDISISLSLLSKLHSVILFFVFRAVGFLEIHYVLLV